METELKSYPALPPSGGRELRLLAEAASEFWDIPLEELKSKTRTMEIVWPRNVCMSIARNSGCTCNKVAKWWKKKEHGTVINATRMVQNLRDTRPAYDKQFRQFSEFAKSYIKKRKLP